MITKVGLAIIVLIVYVGSFLAGCGFGICIVRKRSKKERGRVMSKFYPCAYCTEDGYCKKFSDEKVTSWCIQGPCKDKKPSNGDRIRAMTDEELAKIFVEFDDWTEEAVDLDEEKIYQIWLDWLRKEADDVEIC